MSKPRTTSPRMTIPRERTGINRYCSTHSTRPGLSCDRVHGNAPSGPVNHATERMLTLRSALCAIQYAEGTPTLHLASLSCDSSYIYPWWWYGGEGGDTAEGADPYEPRLDPTHNTCFLCSIFLPARSNLTNCFGHESEIFFKHVKHHNCQNLR